MNRQAAESNVTLDDGVEAELARFLDIEKPTSFFLFAGAGSGKTRSLVQALKHIAAKYRDTLRLRARQVAVITYTNAACNEITRRVEYDPLFVVSTIHSFAWSQILSFNSDIREWLRVNLETEIEELSAEELRGRAGTKASASRQASIEAKGRRLARLNEIRTFTYSPNSDNRERNALNHSEVIRIFAAFLLEKPLMQRMFVEKFPFVLVDESQDTNKALIEALLAVQQAHASRFCLGLIGDTMQRIYLDGKEKIESAIPKSWAVPEKRLNHRSPKRIVRLINKIRGGVDTHTQLPRDDAIEGWAKLFVFPLDTADKPATEDKVRAYMAKATSDAKWNDRDACKILTLEHHMAAKRMGFEKLFEALAPIEQFRTAFLDGSFAPTRFFTHSVLPLVSAQQRGDKFGAARIMRESSPLLNKDMFKGSQKPLDQLRTPQAAIDSLLALWGHSEPTCASILENVAATNLFVLPESLKAALAAANVEAAVSQDNELADPITNNIAALLAFLDCPFSMIKPYAAYVAREAPFDTHQGVKGLEFDRVMVLMDDGDARGFLFGYDKLLGAKSPSAGDFKNEQEGKDSAIDRTRRLFYVTCSRAKSSLALVAYSMDPAAIRAHVVATDLFIGEEVLLEIPSDGQK
jgi:DNA helicase II / ATP-dependent DNA helicase PcrA